MVCWRSRSGMLMRRIRLERGGGRHCCCDSEFLLWKRGGSTRWGRASEGDWFDSSLLQRLLTPPASAPSPFPPQLNVRFVSPHIFFFCEAREARIKPARLHNLILHKKNKMGTAGELGIIVTVGIVEGALAGGVS